MRILRLVLTGIIGLAALVAALFFTGLFVAIFAVFAVLAAIVMLVSRGKLGNISVRASTNRPPPRPRPSGPQSAPLRTDDAIDVIATKLPPDQPDRKTDLLGP